MITGDEMCHFQLRTKSQNPSQSQSRKIPTRFHSLHPIPRYLYVHHLIVKS